MENTMPATLNQSSLLQLYQHQINISLQAQRTETQISELISLVNSFRTDMQIFKESVNQNFSQIQQAMSQNTEDIHALKDQLTAVQQSLPPSYVSSRNFILHLLTKTL